MAGLGFLLKSNKRKVLHHFCRGGAATKKPPSASLGSALGMIHPKKSPSSERKNEKPRPQEEDDKHEESSDSDLSELQEEEREFFEDMRRVMRGEVVSAARVELRRRSSFRKVVGLVGRKMKHSRLRGGAGGGVSAAAPPSEKPARNVARQGEEEALCEKMVILGRRSRKNAVSNLGFFVDETKTQ